MEAIGQEDKDSPEEELEAHMERWAHAPQSASAEHEYRTIMHKAYPEQDHAQYIIDEWEPLGSARRAVELLGRYGDTAEHRAAQTRLDKLEGMGVEERAEFDEISAA